VVQQVTEAAARANGRTASSSRDPQVQTLLSAWWDTRLHRHACAAGAPGRLVRVEDDVTIIVQVDIEQKKS
jgi:hypothetical protein